MSVRICPKCGGKVSESRSDCIHCGYVFDFKTCPDCNGNVNSNNDVCNICGHVFINLNKKYNNDDMSIFDLLDEELGEDEEIVNDSAEKLDINTNNDEIVENQEDSDLEIEKATEEKSDAIFSVEEVKALKELISLVPKITQIIELYDDKTKNIDTLHVSEKVTKENVESNNAILDIKEEQEEIVESNQKPSAIKEEQEKIIDERNKISAEISDANLKKDEILYDNQMFGEFKNDITDSAAKIEQDITENNNSILFRILNVLKTDYSINKKEDVNKITNDNECDEVIACLSSILSKPIKGKNHNKSYLISSDDLGCNGKSKRKNPDHKLLATRKFISSIFDLKNIYYNIGEKTIKNIKKIILSDYKINGKKKIENLKDEEVEVIMESLRLNLAIAEKTNGDNYILRNKIFRITASGSIKKKTDAYKRFIYSVYEKICKIY